MVESFGSKLELFLHSLYKVLINLKYKPPIFEKRILFENCNPHIGIHILEHTLERVSVNWFIIGIGAVFLLSPVS